MHAVAIGFILYFVFIHNKKIIIKVSVLLKTAVLSWLQNDGSRAGLQRNPLQLPSCCIEPAENISLDHKKIILIFSFDLYIFCILAII